MIRVQAQRQQAHRRAASRVSTPRICCQRDKAASLDVRAHAGQRRPANKLVEWNRLEAAKSQISANRSHQRLARRAPGRVDQTCK